MTTKEASKQVGKNPTHLAVAIYSGYIPAPERFGKAYNWTDSDVENAKNYFNRKGNK